LFAGIRLFIKHWKTAAFSGFVEKLPLIKNNDRSLLFKTNGSV
jgi:hypothetical protein